PGGRCSWRYRPAPTRGPVPVSAARPVDTAKINGEGAGPGKAGAPGGRKPPSTISGLRGGRARSPRPLTPLANSFSFIATRIHQGCSPREEVDDAGRALRGRGDREGVAARPAHGGAARREPGERHRLRPAVAGGRGGAGAGRPRPGGVRVA